MGVAVPAIFFLLHCTSLSPGERTGAPRKSVSGLQQLSRQLQPDAAAARSHGQQSSMVALSSNSSLKSADRLDSQANRDVGCSADGPNSASAEICALPQDVWKDIEQGLQDVFDDSCKNSFASCGPKANQASFQECSPGGKKPVQNYRGGPLPEECWKNPEEYSHIGMLALVSNECTPDGEDLKKETITWAKSNWGDLLQHYDITGTRTTICVIAQAFDSQSSFMERVPVVASSGVQRGDEEIAAMILTGMIRHILFAYGVHKNTWHGRVKMSLINAMRTVRFVDKDRMMAVSIEEAEQQKNKLKICPYGWEGKSWCSDFVEDKKLCPIISARPESGECHLDMPDTHFNPCYAVLQCQGSNVPLSFKVESQPGESHAIIPRGKCNLCKLPEWHVPCVAVKVAWHQQQCIVTQDPDAGYTENKCQLVLTCESGPELREIIDWTTDTASRRTFTCSSKCKLKGHINEVIGEMRAIFPATSGDK